MVTDGRRVDAFKWGDALCKAESELFGAIMRMDPVFDIKEAIANMRETLDAIEKELEQEHEDV